ncbi:hypothetical protein BP6252_10919 [Coleophoma cylindrospora]|uniref:Uncharacterized protein n=1 Tax=Coleophoma cylindrospora TaxID=1849047 RepID=A0A3D8QPJ7_9HELO|nr:hypothetical protein BP6252_10919 [Coleophoma cylindrospora]
MVGAEDQPDLLVGVDFGMTYTGVAWVNLLNPSVISPIIDWPPLSATAKYETKTPSKIAYAQDNAVARWGFLCDENDDCDEQDQVKQSFKIYLDQDSIDAARRAGIDDMPSVEEAKRLVADYLRQVYMHIKKSIEASTGPWYDKKVDFIFTMPTTWTSQKILKDFEEAIRRAGFGSENESKHSAKLELTEAEAAGVFVVANPPVHFEAGDILLVCDAGGGTTDLGLVQIFDAKVPSLKQLAAVSGVGIGSTMIDTAFQLLVRQRMEAYPDILPPETAYKLAESATFQSIKHNFGTAYADQAQYKIGLNMGQDLTHPGLRIERGKMLFSRVEIQCLFDRQIAGIIRVIDRQFDWIGSNRNGQYVKYLILSGGLGSSEYVKTRLMEKYTSSPHTSAPNLIIIKSSDPRLAVVKGLLLDRRQKLVSPHSVLITRVARASYGVICRMPYDPNLHASEDVEMDPYNKKHKWAVRQIDWLIKKGDTINSDSFQEREFFRKMDSGDLPSARKWDTVIVVSHSDRELLPRSMKQPGATRLCKIQSDLKEVLDKELKLKNKHFWQGGQRYHLAAFTIRVTIAPADLKFELWFKGKKYNRSHDPVTVEWDPVGASVKPKPIIDDADPDWQMNSEDGGWISYGVNRPSENKFLSAFDLQNLQIRPRISFSRG